jgi:hypothetical protein
MSQPPVAIVTLVLWAAASLGIPSHAPVPATCDRAASPTGSDSASGSVERPFRTAQRLIDSLDPGETGCLREGTYVSTERLVIRRSGRADAPIRVTSYPGETARIRHDIVWITDHAHHVTLDRVEIDGSGHSDVTVMVQGDAFALRNSVVGNANVGKSCVILGNGPADPVADADIRGNVLHDCGSYANGNQDHAVYAADTTGLAVADNVIYGAPGWAVHLYPNAQRSLVSHNVIDDNGRGILIGGDATFASSGNAVDRNIITHATAEYLVSGSWGNATGTGNVVTSNCLYFGGLGTLSGRGFFALSNTEADPGFHDRSARDYRLRPDSPCRAVVGYDTAATGSTRRPLRR